MKEFSEWGQCQVLDLLRRYQPTSEDDLFDVLVGTMTVWTPGLNTEYGGHNYIVTIIIGIYYHYMYHQSSIVFLYIYVLS